MKKIFAFYFILALGILSSCQKTETKITPPTSSFVSDFDGNQYRVRNIGGREWMTENLKVTHFNNGDSIPEIKDDFDWITSLSSGWCSYNNDSSNSRIYGNLYNWYVATDPRGVCPDGYHVPTSTEFQDLITSLGGINIAGQELKAVDTLWEVYSISVYNTNTSGFTALPAGLIDFSARFYGLRSQSVFWSSYNSDPAMGEYMGISNQTSESDVSTIQKNNGLSIRCVKN